MTTEFKDHFSAQSEAYAEYRPHYPKALFAHLAQLTPTHDLAWDCATGSGQAAIELASYYQRVIATDASEKQICQAVPCDNIDYQVMPAEQTTFADHSLDLITVAQALHWFDLPHFYGEVKRVLKPEGIIAVWTYNLLSVTPEIDALLQFFYDKIIKKYWSAERQFVENNYATLDFPFTIQEAPTFTMRAEWNLKQLLGYLSTWSAVIAYEKEQLNNPLLLIFSDLEKEWGSMDQVREITWPLTVKIGTR